MSDRLFISTRKGFFVARRGANGWSVGEPHFLGENATLALADPRDGTWYVAMNLGHFGVKLKASTDEGRTWEERAVPAYAEGMTYAAWDGKPPEPATLKLIWALEAGHASQPGRLWCGTLPGGLFRSDDGGRTWVLNEPLWNRPERMRWFGGGADQPGIHSICLDPRDPRTLRIAVSCGGVWVSTDDGESWENVGKGMRAEYVPPEQAYDTVGQDPHIMVQCPSQPNRIWVQHHNGVFRSDDAAGTFTEITNAQPTVFGFAVAVHPKNGDRAWFVPGVKDECRVPKDGKLVVSRTSDAGTTFELLTNGLPQVPSYDLVFRHALTIDESGERLAFGSTTGGLWTTENGGDSWTMLPARLPPIHAVRFA